jgi:hypothetical protein
MKSPIRPINLCTVLLSVIFLCFVNQLRAKCPVAYVDVSGRIQCSFKPEDKILATLIFHDHQPGASGEEAAFDIHGDSFSGRIVFNTYSSSGLLGGDKCRRSPEKVVIRLVEADGTEKYRTTLIIASNFDYNKEQGKYTPKSDVILHGECQSNHSSRFVGWIQ